MRPHLLRRHAIALLIAAAPLAAAAGTDTVRATPGDPVQGKKLFAKCVPCHKADGSGGIRLTGNPTPNWRDAKRMAEPRYGDAYLLDCMTKGKPKSGMQPVATLGVKPAEMIHLIAYIRAFSAKKRP